MQDLKDKLISFFEECLSDIGYEVVDIDLNRSLKHGLVRLYIDSPSGITLEDCVKVSKTISPELDDSDIISFPYNLEVSSPGVNRSLRKKSDFVKFKGKRITVKTSVAINNKTKFEGVIQDVLDESLHVMSKSGDVLLIKLALIEKAKLA